MFCGNERGWEEDIGYFLFCRILLFRHFGGFDDFLDDEKPSSIIIIYHPHHRHSCVGHRWLNTKGPGRPLNSKPLCSGRVAGQTNSMLMLLNVNDR